ncbi:glomulin [Anastrepha ludens]|uniref:glomulin n=1 Tax=Anastrepha ludens TaxID=28586 RepID=UPI0023AF2E4F|nr:glomulin [Anastrepha ludens]
MEHMLEQPQLPHNIPSPVEFNTNLVELIKQLIKENQYEGVALLFTSEPEATRNISCLQTVGMELYHDVCVSYLTTQIHDEQPPLYTCAEELLCLIAAHAPTEELLLELLDIVEEQKSEYVFTSALRALQVVLLRMGNKKPRALEWCLNSIRTRIEGLPLPKYLKEGYDRKQERLLEQNEEIEKLLMHFITVDLFYEPLLRDVLLQQCTTNEIFFDTSINRRNVLCCFLIQMLGKPLALLDLSSDERKTNIYTIQCARKLTKGATRCLVDPLRLLSVGEYRVRWCRRLDADKGVHEMSSNNIFLIEEKLPLESLAIYFYMLFVEEISLASVPKIYLPIYIFETGIYYANELLAHEESPLHYRALLLVKRLLDNLLQTKISAVSLELEVHKNFCNILCNIVGYSSQNDLRQIGIKLLRQYILQFDEEGKYLVLKNLLRTVTHNGISGYLAIMYKDLVGKALVTSVATDLPSTFSGQDFRTIILQYICRLPHGAKTDLIENSDSVISSLNALRFFAMKDHQNRTGLWDFMPEIEKQFLEPLRKGLEISVAHYKAELKRVEYGLGAKEEAKQRKNLEMLDINIANATTESGNINLEVNRQRKIEILNQNLCTFDLMRSLLGRAVECVESSSKLSKSTSM